MCQLNLTEQRKNQPATRLGPDKSRNRPFVRPALAMGRWDFTLPEGLAPR